jgi:hypothetical protein
MRLTVSNFCVWGALLAGCAPAQGTNACPQSPYEARHVGKAIYFQSNEQSNSVISIPIGHDGKLYGGGVTATGGRGGDSIDGTTLKPAGPDALSSQGSVVVSDNVSWAELAPKSPRADWFSLVSFRRKCWIGYFEHVQDR